VRLIGAWTVAYTASSLNSRSTTPDRFSASHSLGTQMSPKRHHSAAAASQKRGTRLLVPLIIVGCVSLAGWWLGNMLASGVRKQSSQTSIKTDRHDFALVDTSGQRVSLDTYRGKWIVVFFGFTSCPEACPTTLLKLGAALRDLAGVAANLQPIFITVDPERDSPDVLKEYLANFGDNIVGLSGSGPEIAAVAKSFGVYFAKRQTEAGDYTVDHSTALYLIAPDGQLLRPMSISEDPHDFALELSAAMATKK